MTNSKHTKKALFSSIVALLLCFTMLMGATFAWFTDNVSSTGNRIQAGDLEVDLIMYNGSEYVSIGGDDGDIFSQAAGGNGINWEPGKTEIVYLGVKNNGSLALKYNIVLDIENGNPGLVGSLEYAIIDGATSADTYANWEEVKAAAKGQTDDIAAGRVIAAPDGVLDEIIKAEDPRNVEDKDREVDYFALAVHMKEEAGNEYENASISIDVNVTATQKDAEEDSFGPDYDKEAEFPWDGVTLEAPKTVNGVLQVGKPSELAWLAASSSPIDHATLTADIDMMNATISSIEIYAYRTFNGNGHTISNVVVDGAGLFGNLSSDCTIKDITLDNITVNTTSGDYAGIVNGKFSGKYENVTVLNSTVNAPNSEYVGGLAGAAYKNIVNCNVENISVTGTEKVGGLVGFFSLADVGYSITLDNCSAKNVTVTATNPAKSYAGVFFGRGLASGSRKFTFTNCSAAMKADQKLIGQDYYNNIDTSAIAVTTLQ